MAFTTKIDFSSNRQVKQYEQTFTSLSGGTIFGVPFSGLSTGPNLTTSGITYTDTFGVSTFSGNSGVTIYTWYRPIMELGASSLSALTPANSGITQNTGENYSGTSFITIDGNISALAYTGVSFDISDIVLYDMGGGNYSGTVVSNVIDYLSATTLDFTGRTIWVDVQGITRTEKLIVSDTPQIGAVLTCIDSEGMASWQTSTGSTINPQKTISADYALVDGDNNYLIFVDNGATPISITVPSTLIDNFSAGFIQLGTANVSFVAGGGSTVINPASEYKIKGIYYQVCIDKYGNIPTYYLLGNTKP